MSSSVSLLTSGYGSKILLFLLEASLKEKSKTQLEWGEKLSFMVKHPRLENMFYAVHEKFEGAVSRWKLDDQGQFKMLQKETGWQGKHPTHISINDEENALFIANYGGSFTAMKLSKETGEIIGGQTEPYGGKSEFLNF